LSLSLDLEDSAPLLRSMGSDGSRALHPSSSSNSRCAGWWNGSLDWEEMVLHCGIGPVGERRRCGAEDETGTGRDMDVEL
jgi:hypothetical protein